MKNKPIIILIGDMRGVFLEIFFKSLKKKQYNSPLLLICSKKEFEFQMKIFGFKRKIREVNFNNIFKTPINNKSINILNIDKKDYSVEKYNSKINNYYLVKSFKIAFDLIKKNYTNKLINGPINKKNFLSKKYLGITEYLASMFNKKDVGMLIYNKNLSVCPLTTHLPLKKVVKKITKKLIQNRIKMIDGFYKKNFKVKPKIGVTGINPHCESIDKINEDVSIVQKAIKYCSKLKINVKGPFSADTIFLKNNRKNYNVIMGMYHDQVLTPIKTLYEYNAINITMGLPFLRVSPDHGPNKNMYGQNKSNPESLAMALNFLDKK